MPTTIRQRDGSCSAQLQLLIMATFLAATCVHVCALQLEHMYRSREAVIDKLKASLADKVGPRPARRVYMRATAPQALFKRSLLPQLALWSLTGCPRGAASCPRQGRLHPHPRSLPPDHGTQQHCGRRRRYAQWQGGGRHGGGGTRAAAGGNRGAV